MALKKIWPFRLISLVLLLALILPNIIAGTVQADPGWFNASWQYRKQITIDHTKVSADLSYFPVLISLTDTDLAAHALSNGDDILFTDVDGTTQLKHEIEKYDSGTGELVAWVRVLTVFSATDTDIYMYYGNSGAGNQEQVTSVWDSNYKLVQHLEESSGGASAVLDSTSNTNHGTDTGSPTFGATGQMDGAITFDGSNYVDFGNDGSLHNTGSVTVEAWIYFTASNANKWIVSKAQSGNLKYYLFLDGSDNIAFRFTPDNGGLAGWFLATGGAVSTGAWHHVVGVYNGSNVLVYLDSVLTTDEPYSGSVVSTTSSVSIGDHYSFDGTFAFTGNIDEVRVSHNARSSNWISTSYNNQNSPDKAVHGASGFFTVGSQASQAPTAVGGTVYPINKARVLLPWLFLFSVLSLSIVSGAFHLRKSA